MNDRAACALRLLCVLSALFLSLVSVSATAAAGIRAPKGSVAVTKKNQSTFIELGKEGRAKVLCRYQGSRASAEAVGFLRKDKALKLKLWKSFKTSIKEIKKNKALKKRARARQLAIFVEYQARYSQICADIITPPDPVIARLNSGGDLYVDTSGKTWSSDASALFAGTTNHRNNAMPDVLGTSRDWLYWTTRQGPELNYSFIRLNNQAYDVILHFVEFGGGVVTGPGKRVFDIEIEGVPVQSNLDIYQAAGGTDRALVLSFPVSISDGRLDLSLTPSAGSVFFPSIAALEIRPQGSSSEADDVRRLDNGADGGELSEPGVGLWDDDGFYVLGDGAQTTRTLDPAQEIAGTDEDELFRSERFGLSFGYVLGDSSNPLPAGTYEVGLHFAEFEWTQPGERVFDVTIERVLLLNNFDILADVGAVSTATSKLFQVVVSDGQLNIDFEGVVDYAKVSAVSVRKLS